MPVEVTWELFEGAFVQQETQETFLSLSYSKTYGRPASKINWQIFWQLVC